MVKSKILPYEFSYLSMVKNIWTHSKIFEQGQKLFELADGLGISTATAPLAKFWFLEFNFGVNNYMD